MLQWRRCYSRLCRLPLRGVALLQRNASLVSQDGRQRERGCCPQYAGLPYRRWTPLRPLSCIVDNSREEAVWDDTQRTDSYSELQTGRLELVLGPMFSGKTTELMKRVERDRLAGLDVIAVKSKIDTRYAATQEHHSYMVSHSGAKLECYSFERLSAFKEKFPSVYGQCQGIAIDEAQFFPDLLEFCLQAIDKDGKTVYVAGLDGDFTRSPFSVDGTCQLLNLVPLADVVDKYLAKCRYCADNAPFTFRTVKDDRAVLVGGADMYVPVCRKHYVKMWNELEAN